MAIKIDLLKRKLKARPGRKPQYRYHLRWFDENGVRRCESSGTGDKLQAEALRNLRWQEVNGIIPKPAPPQPVAVIASWADCSKALERAMAAANLRPTYVASALLTMDSLRKMFPESKGPAEISVEQAQEWKRLRSEAECSPWTIKSELASIKAAYKRLASECGLLADDCDPFRKVKAPHCDEPEKRIVSAAEQAELFAWLDEQWQGWQLPKTYLWLAGVVGWRATELASLKQDDLLVDGYLRCRSGRSKTRKEKHAWLPAEQYAELQACGADGWAFGRFSEELKRRLLFKQQPNHAARVRPYAPERLVGWLQDQLQRFNEAKAKADKDWVTFSLHDFRKAAITNMMAAGVTEKDCGVSVGATPQTMRKHYDSPNQKAIARRNTELRLRGGDAAAG